MPNRKDQLIDYINGEWSGENFKDLALELYESPEDIKLLLQLNMHDNPKIAWRSAYLLDLAHDINPSILDNYLELIMERTPKLSNQ
ncbi:MAG: hypothetical protein MI866_09870, partial [Bacteroidales bacterium]|nr:hypothetical protein [Bacteroidales bacterium]